MRITTHIKANPKRQEIIGAVIGQMSDGIWENTRSMEKYWKSLDYGVSPDGYIWLDDRNGVTADVYDFFANKIKKIIQIEAEDNPTSGIRWDRNCSATTVYLNYYQNITVGDCYELYELLKGRNTAKNRYATYSNYDVTLSYGGTDITLLVEALNEYDAKKVAIKKLTEKMTAKVVKA